MLVGNISLKFLSLVMKVQLTYTSLFHKHPYKFYFFIFKIFFYWCG